MPRGKRTPTHAVIDGSNFATEGRKEPSLDQLDEAVRTIAAEFDFDQITVIVDATFEHRVAKAETSAARTSIDDGNIITPPAGVIGRGDAFILQVADRAGAVVFSNDSFQEFHGTYKWLFDEGRLVGGKPIPALGWIFVARSPVRGPVSRRATADSKREDAKAAPAAAKSRTRKAASTPRPSSKSTPEPTPEPTRSARPRKARSKTTTSGDGSNDANAWKTFKTDFPVGSTIAAHVDRFSSHGAYGSVDDVVVYLPNRLLGHPAPTKARDVLDLGDTVDFVVHRYDDERLGIDAGLIPVPGSASREPARKATTKRAAKAPAKKAAKRTRKRTTKTSAVTPVEKTTAKKAPAKKTAAKKAPAKKTAAKKAAGKKTTAKATKKAPARKTAAKKAAGRAPAKKAAASRRSTT